MRNLYKTARIVRIEQETLRVKNIYLDCAVGAKPGQYVMVWIPRKGEKPFAVGWKKPMLLSIAKVGPFSSLIHQLNVGDQVTFRGPYGSSFKPKGRKLLLIGGGYGMVPLYLLAKQQLKATRRNIAVVIGAKTKKDLVYSSKFKNLGCRVYVTTDDGSAGFKGFSTELAEQLVVKNRFDAIYTCGPEMMMKKIAVIAKKHHIFCQVSVERHFKCGGMGLCGECSFNGRIVCKEGPVFAGRVLLSK